MNSDRYLPIAVAGGLLGAIGASSCCVLPMVLLSVSVGGTWVGTTGALTPYQPYIAGISVVLIAWGFWLVWRRARLGCAADEPGEGAFQPGGTIVMLGIASILVIASIAFPYVEPYWTG